MQSGDADQEVWQRNDNALGGLVSRDPSRRVDEFERHRVDWDCLTQFRDEGTPPLVFFHRGVLNEENLYSFAGGCKVPRRSARSFMKAKNTGTRIST